MLCGGMLVFSAFSSEQSACAAPEASQFDFWLGTWELTWKDSSGKELHGNNLITKDLGGCVIHERFSDSEQKFRGESWSVWNPARKIWQQTWVDNSGSYLAPLTGGMSDGRMELTMERINPQGQAVLFRMVFFNITYNTFDWEWKRSKDKGTTWEVLWSIHYKRKG